MGLESKDESKDEDEAMGLVRGDASDRSTGEYVSSLSVCAGVSASTVVAALSYALASSSMLVLNKLALLHFPLPGTLMSIQCASTAVFVLFLQGVGAVERERTSWKDVLNFFGVPALYTAALFSSTSLLLFSNAETQIIIRTSTPAAVALLDWALMGYRMPDARSFLILIGLICATTIFFKLERGIGALEPAALAWGWVYFISITAEMVLVKFIMNKVRMSTWTRVLYNNAMVIMFMPLLLAATSECATRARARGAWSGRAPRASTPSSTPHGGARALSHSRARPCRAHRHVRIAFYFATNHHDKLSALAGIVLSSVGGTAMSFTGFKLRHAVSATTFTLIGVVCKLATILVNQFIWDHHAGALSSLVLCASIVLSTQYKAPGMREGLQGADGCILPFSPVEKKSGKGGTGDDSDTDQTVAEAEKAMAAADKLVKQAASVTAKA